MLQKLQKSSKQKVRMAVLLTLLAVVCVGSVLLRFTTFSHPESLEETLKESAQVVSYDSQPFACRMDIYVYKGTHIYAFYNLETEQYDWYCPVSTNDTFRNWFKNSPELKLLFEKKDGTRYEVPMYKAEDYCTKGLTEPEQSFKITFPY